MATGILQCTGSYVYVTYIVRTIVLTIVFMICYYHYLGN